MTHSEVDHLVSYHQSDVECIYLIVYDDDIILTSSHRHDISKMKQHLCHHFQTKDLGKLKYFSGIEVAQFNNGIIISQIKYTLDILEEIGFMNSKFVDMSLDPNTKLLHNQRDPFSRGR